MAVTCRDKVLQAGMVKPLVRCVPKANGLPDIRARAAELCQRSGAPSPSQALVLVSTGSNVGRWVGWRYSGGQQGRWISVPWVSESTWKRATALEGAESLFGAGSKDALPGTCLKVQGIGDLFLSYMTELGRSRGLSTQCTFWMRISSKCGCFHSHWDGWVAPAELCLHLLAALLG